MKYLYLMFNSSGRSFNLFMINDLIFSSPGKYFALYNFRQGSEDSARFLIKSWNIIFMVDFPLRSKANHSFPYFLYCLRINSLTISIFSESCISLDISFHNCLPR